MSCWSTRKSSTDLAITGPQDAKTTMDNIAAFQEQLLTKSGLIAVDLSSSIVAVGRRPARDAARCPLMVRP